MENVISVKECMEMFDSDVEFMKEMIVLMREDMVECSAIVSKTYNDNDTMGLKNMAHRIKGQAAMVSANSLRDAAKKVENSANAGGVTTLEYLGLVLKIKEFIRNTRDL